METKFIFTYPTHTMEYQYRLEVPIYVPFGGTAEELSERLMKFFRLPAAAEKELTASLKRFLLEKTEKFFDKMGDDLVLVAKEDDLETEEAIKSWEKAFKTETVEYSEPEGATDEELFSAVYHKLVHSPALEPILQVEHSYALAVHELLLQREEQVEGLTTIDILLKNGSVVDAAIATSFCNGIVTCQSMGLGGGFLMTLYINKTAVTLNARETAPAQVREKLYDDEQKSKIGALAVGVPGELRGYWEAHKRYGKLPWSDLVAPAIAVCEGGYNMSRHQADSLRINAAAVKSDPTLSEIFVDPATGKFYSEGTLIKHNKLCETLKVISKEGGDALYTGSLAEKLAQDIQERGGIITVDDLKNYRPVWEAPVTAELHGKHTLYSVPPPGSGILLAFILNILNGYNFTASSVSDINQTITTYHRTIEAFKYAYARRTELGDPHFLNISQVISMLQSKEYAETVRRKINDTQTYQDPKHYGAVYYSKDDHGTAHISIIGPNGDAVSVTSTVNIYFGAGVASKQTGIILNSVMDDFSFSNYKNYFGLPGSPANAVKPWKRPLSSMCPSIIVDEDKNVKLVIGASGGTKITTAVATVIMRYLWFGDNIKEAVDASRIHHQLYPMLLSYEYGVLDQVVKGLEKLGHLTDRYKSRGSIICAIVKEAEYIFANADYRKRGDVYGID